MMAHARARGRARRPGNVPHQGGWLIFTRPEQHWLFRLLGLIIRARAELTVTTTIIAIYLWLTPNTEPMPLTGHPTQRVQPPTEWLHTTTLMIMAGGVAVLAIIPVSRRYLCRRAWCVITRRRLRAAWCKPSRWPAPTDDCRSCSGRDHPRSGNTS